MPDGVLALVGPCWALISAALFSAWAGVALALGAGLVVGAATGPVVGLVCVVVVVCVAGNGPAAVGLVV